MKIFEVNIDPEDCEKYGLHCTASCVKWWLQQDKEAQRKLFQNEIPLKMALNQLIDFLKDATVIWQHSSFDKPIIDNAIKKVGIINPIHYSVWKDLRSAEYCLNINKNQFSFEGIGHNVIDDCKNQIKRLVYGFNGRIEFK